MERAAFVGAAGETSFDAASGETAMRDMSFASDEPTRIVLVRHGETAWNAGGRIQGQLDIELNEVGLWQAERLAESLTDTGLSAVYSSDLQRARQTAAAVARATGLALQEDVGLRERGFGMFEGHSWKEIETRWPEESVRWRRRDLGFEPEGGEALPAFSARCVGAVKRVAAAHPGESIAIVAHGGVLDCLYRAATRVDLQAARTWQLANASINRLLYSAEGLVLVGWNDVSHLEGATRDDELGDEAGAGVARRSSTASEDSAIPRA